jgi:hypothetical protein
VKIRWTEGSVRFRITPSELASLERGEPVVETLKLPGGTAWSARIAPGADVTGLRFEAGTLQLALIGDDVAQLAAPENEGVYLPADSAAGVRYFVEKDFPCAHPRAAEALEPQSETFTPPPEFEQRKQQ